jgi:hypothetical protein
VSLFSSRGSTLRHSTLTIEGAADPAAGILPILAGIPPRTVTDSDSLDEDMRQSLAYGRAATLLPYTTQDSYNRSRSVRELPSVVLQNETLTATFLPGVGGRLWSLVHRPSSRELLHRNPIFQPANLALRDAWLAGGVEWNLGTTGHWPLTCEPLHAVALRTPDGTPVLRMFEFERMRRLVLRIDAWLPAGSPVLLVHVAIQNPSSQETPIYWWSNIAVPETEKVRVVGPAAHAFHFDYAADLRRVGFPDFEGHDRSYPGRVGRAADYFLDIPDSERRWIAALDENGSGLVQTSTGRLRGRKLFHWGTSTGGKRWQEWLSGPGSQYLEIQAGVARTQLEHVPIPPQTTWSWVEAYGLLEADPAAVHGTWDSARAAAGEALERLVPAARLEQALAEVAEWRPTMGNGFGFVGVGSDDAGRLSRAEESDMRSGDAERLIQLTDDGADAEVALLSRGSGWGALEVAAGYLSPSADLPFGSCDAEQRPWLDLLRFGQLPVSDPPASAVTGSSWRALLETSASDWHAFYHLGLLRLADGDRPGAQSAWERSVAEERTPWALRALAFLASPTVAADLLTEAHALRPDLRELTIETIESLLLADRPAGALAIIEALDADDRAVGRIRLLEARSALAIAERDRVVRLLDEGITVDNLREGEVSLDSLWLAVHPDEPVPARYDFRMS